jgi:hypothetical protein
MLKAVVDAADILTTNEWPNIGQYLTTCSWHDDDGRL